jgi:hypothetical protein
MYFNLCVPHSWLINQMAFRREKKKVQQILKSVMVSQNLTVVPSSRLRNFNVGYLFCLVQEVMEKMIVEKAEADVIFDYCYFKQKWFVIV